MDGWSGNNGGGGGGGPSGVDVVVKGQEKGQVEQIAFEYGLKEIEGGPDPDRLYIGIEPVMEVRGDETTSAEQILLLEFDGATVEQAEAENTGIVHMAVKRAVGGHVPAFAESGTEFDGPGFKATRVTIPPVLEENQAHFVIDITYDEPFATPPLLSVLPEVLSPEDDVFQVPSVGFDAALTDENGCRLYFKDAAEFVDVAFQFAATSL